MRPPFAFPWDVGTNPAEQTNPRPGDLRRAIPRPIWFANRAGNALHRPAFIGAVGTATFVTAIVAMVVALRASDQPRPVTVFPRPDTLTLAANIALANVRLDSAEWALAAARNEATTVPPVDSPPPLPAAVADSLGRRARDLEILIARAEQAPLPSSYRALAAAPALATDVRVRALLDSLAEVERERERIGAAGGIDPIFVALTSRASEIGRAIQAIAVERRATVLAELNPPVESLVPPTPVVDTMPFVAERDSIRAALAETTAELGRRRTASQAIDVEENRARAQASAVAPVLALLAAAFVLSVAMGFAIAFIGELRRPRVSTAHELERHVGIRVLSVVETPVATVERGRRRADRSAPPYLEPGAEGFQLAYLGLATMQPTLLAATITGDDVAQAAVVACNLAAVAAVEARNAVVLDADPHCWGSAVMQSRVSPGVADVVGDTASWSEVTVATRVGRDKSVDLIPCGTASRPSAEDMASALRRDRSRLARYYDAILAIAATESAGVIASSLPSPDVVFCVQPGVTPLKELTAALERIRKDGGVVRGAVLWHAARPSLPKAHELAPQPRRAPGPPAPPVPAGAAG